MARDPELALRLKQAPNAQERAGLLGIDYRSVVATGWRLRGGVVSISVAYILIFLVTVWMLLSVEAPGDGPLSIALRPIVDGFVAGLMVVTVRLLVSSVAMQFLSSTRLSPLRQQEIAVPLNSVSGSVGLLIALAVLPTESSGAVVLGFAVLGGLMGIAGIQSLPLAIVMNDPNLPKVVEVMKAIPVDMTLLGGRVRWILACFAIGLVDATAVALIFSVAPGAALIVVPAHALVALVVVRQAWTKGLAASLPIAAVAAMAFFATGVIAAAMA